jgi:filamentous hemagglutinin
VADAIGGNSAPSSLKNIAEHAALGCATGAVLGSGCEGGAIGAATSALVAPYLVSEAGGTANLTDLERALIVAAAEGLGGAAAGALGQDSMDGAAAAQNEVLYNTLGERPTEEEKDAEEAKKGLSPGKQAFGQARLSDDESGDIPVITGPRLPVGGIGGGFPSGATIDLGTGANEWDATNGEAGSGSYTIPAGIRSFNRPAATGLYIGYPVGIAGGSE